jgi:Protein of unknown function (DUF3892)
MATSHEIKCINKSDRYNIHERILSIGGLKNDGTSWKLSLNRAIKGIEDGDWTFYVNKAGNKVNVVIAETSQGNKYLKTEADTTDKNNLLELPECK